jgi:TonB family protein
MNAAAVTRQLAAIRSRTRGSVFMSLIFHAAFFFCISLAPGGAPPAQPLIEIAWLDEGPPGLAAPAAAAPTVKEAKKVEEMPSRHEAHARFERDVAEAEVAPTPEEIQAVEDRLRTRLTALQGESTQLEPAVAVLAAVANANAKQSGHGGIGTSNLAGLPGGTGRAGANGSGEGGGGTVGLRRAPSAPPLALTRAAARPPESAPALSKLREERPASKPAAPAKASHTARQIMAGMTLKGPVADRPILSYVAPVYPEWAKREGVEATVQLYFEVLPAGQVKESILVEKTSGFEDFDQNAIRALRTWKFEALGPGGTGEQWGSITMKYRLDDAGIQ